MTHKTASMLVACLGAALFLAAPASAQQAGLSGSVPQNVLRATLPNGLRVVIVPDRLAPVVNTSLNYLAGSNDAPPGFPGTAHALEHMMFRGSESLDKDQLAEVGALLGGVYNASTEETNTQYTYTVPAKDLGLVLQIEAGRMRGLSLNEADWAQERGAIEQEVSRDLSSPFYNYLAAVQSILFAGTPYENDALGTRPSFDKTDAALLRAFYDRWYAPNNAILVIAGDVQPDAALAQVQQAFGAIPARPIPEHAPILPAAVTAKTLELPTNLPVGVVSLAYRMPGLRSPDFAAADILGDVLGSERYALYALVPTGRALMAQYSYQPKAAVGIGLAIAAFPAGADPAPVLADLRRVIAEAVANGLPPELIEASKQKELAQLAFENDSISGLARIWSRALALGGMDSPEELARAYAAVTPDDVNRLARQLLDPGSAVTAVLTPDNTGRPPAGAGFGGAESFNNPPDHPVVLPGWATAALTDLQAPNPTEPPIVTTLPNGLRLIVQPEHVSHTVSVYGRVREVADIQQPPGQDGVSTLTAQLFREGTATRGRLAFNKAMDDIAANYGTGFGFQLKVLTPHFEPGMRLLAENQLNPAFPADAFAVAQKQLAQSLAGLPASPGHKFSVALETATLPPNDPALREATPATVMALKPEDVRAYYKAAFRPDLATIVVVGDVTPAEALRVVTETFGGWEATGPAPAIDLPPIGPNPPATLRIGDPSSLQDSVTLVQTLAVPVTSPDRYTLLLGNTILGGDFTSRLSRDLRVKTGYVYSVSSAFDWSRTRGSYTVSFGADPVNVGKARDLVASNLRTMQTVPVSDGELTRAKTQILRRLAMQRASVGAIASLYLRLVELGLPLDSQDLAAERYKAITAAQIQQAFSQWIRVDGMVQAVKGPPLTP